MKKLFAIISIICLSGCMNVMYHLPPQHSTDIYQPTCFVACNGVGSWWNTEYKKRYPIEAAWMELTWLVWVVDLPCEAVMDTIWLPYDLHRKGIYEKSKAKHGFKAESNYKPYTLENGEYSIEID